MIPIISFTYFSIEKLDLDQVYAYIDQLLSSNNINKLFESYVLFSHNNSNKFHDCPMYEIFKNDLYEHNEVFLLYQKLFLKYSKNIIEKIIIEKEDHIKNKIINIINFAFDNIYKKDNIINIIFKYDIRNKFNSIPNIIYSSIGYEFNIIKQKNINNRCEINIMKRRNNS